MHSIQHWIIEFLLALNVKALWTTVLHIKTLFYCRHFFFILLRLVLSIQNEAFCYFFLKMSITIYSSSLLFTTEIFVIISKKIYYRIKITKNLRWIVWANIRRLLWQENTGSFGNDISQRAIESRYVEDICS